MLEYRSTEALENFFIQLGKAQTTKMSNPSTAQGKKEFESLDPTLRGGRQRTIKVIKIKLLVEVSHRDGLNIMYISSPYPSGIS